MTLLFNVLWINKTLVLVLLSLCSIYVNDMLHFKMTFFPIGYALFLFCVNLQNFSPLKTFICNF